MDYLVSVVVAHAVLIQKICWIIYCSPFYLCPVHFSAVIGASREQAPHLWINRKIVYLFRYMFIYIYLGHTNLITSLQAAPVLFL